jgi:hypothetical protein
MNGYFTRYYPTNSKYPSYFLTFNGKRNTVRQSRYIATSNYYSLGSNELTLHVFPRILWPYDIVMNRANCYMQLTQIKNQL